MPELPEVEAVRRALEACIVGRRVVSVRGASVALRRPLDPGQIAAALVGARFAGVDRRGKFLLLSLRASGLRVLVHLGMTGHLAVCAADAPLARHSHLRLELDDGRELRYVDPRRFGFVALLPNGVTDPSLARLGLEPLAEGFVERVVPLLRSRRGPIKHVLMDQSVIAGVGNIYASESLWRAGVHPRRAANRTSRRRLAAVAGEVRAVLADAIVSGGTTLRDYAQPDGSRGEYSSALKAYGRPGEPCDRCGARIRRLVMSGRATYYCVGCQT